MRLSLVLLLVAAAAASVSAIPSSQIERPPGLYRPRPPAEVSVDPNRGRGPGKTRRSIAFAWNLYDWLDSAAAQMRREAVAASLLAHRWANNWVGWLRGRPHVAKESAVHFGLPLGREGVVNVVKYIEKGGKDYTPDMIWDGQNLTWVNDHLRVKVNHRNSTVEGRLRVNAANGAPLSVPLTILAKHLKDVSGGSRIRVEILGKGWKDLRIVLHVLVEEKEDPKKSVSILMWKLAKEVGKWEKEEKKKRDELLVKYKKGRSGMEHRDGHDNDDEDHDKDENKKRNKHRKDDDGDDDQDEKEHKKDKKHHDNDDDDDHDKKENKKHHKHRKDDDGDDDQDEKEHKKDKKHHDNDDDDDQDEKEHKKDKKHHDNDDDGDHDDDHQQSKSAPKKTASSVLVWDGQRLEWQETLDRKKNGGQKKAGHLQLRVTQGGVSHVIPLSVLSKHVGSIPVGSKLSFQVVGKTLSDLKIVLHVRTLGQGKADKTKDISVPVATLIQEAAEAGNLVASHEKANNSSVIQKIAPAPKPKKTSASPTPKVNQV